MTICMYIVVVVILTNVFQSIISEVSLFIYWTNWIDFMQQRTTTTTLPLGPNLESSWDCLDPSPAPGGRKMNDLKAGEPPGDISAPSLEDGKIIKIEPNPSFLSGSIYYIYIFIFQDVKRITQNSIVQANFFVSETTFTITPPFFWRKNSTTKQLEQTILRRSWKLC